MKITSVSVLPILIPGKPAVWLKIGTHDYNISHKDPAIAEQLRVYRKHRKIGFDELLESDAAVLATLKDVKPEDKPKALIAAVSLKPSPVGRVVKGEKNHAKRPEKSENAGGSPRPKKD